MRYKGLIVRKLEEIDNIRLGLQSLFSRNPTREQLDNQIDKLKDKVEEVKTLINSEQGE